MHVCENCAKKLPGNCAPQTLGSVAQPCPLKKGAIWVHVVDELANDIGNISCAGPGQKSTDDTGIAVFSPLSSKNYDVNLGDLGDLAKLYDLPSETKKTVAVSDGEITYVSFTLTTKINVITPVITKSPDSGWFEPTMGGDTVAVTLDWTQSRTDSTWAGDGTLAWNATSVDVFKDSACTQTAGAGSITVAKAELKGKIFYVKGKEKGSASLKLTLEDKKEKGFDVKGPVSADIPFELANLATPKLEVEYKVALWERALSANQPSTDITKLFAQPTYVIVSLVETVPGQPYTGKVTLDHDSKLEFFKTRDCAATDKVGPEFTADEIRTATDGKLKIWTRGTAEGKFDLLAKLDEVKGPKVWTAKDPAKEEFGSVKLSVVISPKDAATPFASKDMSEGDKIGKGVVVHAQDAKNFGRLKATIKALEAAKWPAGTDDYEIVLSGGAAGGKVKLFDAQTDGTEVALPAKFKKSALTVDKVIWIEGSTESDALRDSLLDAGIINGSGDLKNYGDWANLTIVKVEAVKPLAEFPTETSPYTAGDYKHYVNQGDKRKIKVKAKLTKDLVGIKLNFIVLADENNQKAANWGEDMPSTWTPASWPDDLKPDDQASSVHINALTVAGGTAEAEVKLSLIGGDKFYVGAFADECAHFRTVKKKETGKPQPVVSKALQIWRKFWYQTTHGSTTAVPAMAAAVGGMERVKIEMALSKDVTFEPSTLPSTVMGAFYKGWKLETGGSEDVKFVIGSHNATYFRGKFDTSGGQAPLVHLMICDAQWDDAGASGLIGPINVKSYSDASTRTTAEFKVTLPNKRAIIDPPFAGGDLLVAGTWESDDGLITGILTNADLVVEQGRTSLRHLKVKLGPTAPEPTTAHPVKIFINVKLGSGGWLGESSGPHILAVPDPVDTYDFCDTVVHEVGHSFNQARGSSSHPALPAGVAARGANRFDKNGSHCKYNYPATPCVMWAEGPEDDGIRRFCKECHPYVLIDEVKPF